MNNFLYIKRDLILKSLFIQNETLTAIVITARIIYIY